jgi:demethylmenaquinone methyltransferase/2-methoxy-6-polyprenyl-1,4-benzoquinol methylase
MQAQPAAPSHYTGDKATFVRSMFSDIAHRYDLLNDVLSFRRHHAWRRRAVALASVHPGDRCLDVCSGTADFALELRRAAGENGIVIGSDFCAPMVVRGRDKAAAHNRSNITMMVADALNLPYPDNQFDVVTVGFGIRNVSDVGRAFAEMCRTAKPGGRVVCLEFNRPRNGLMRSIVGFFEGVVLPRIGGLLSRRDAYEYLNRSIQVFHTREELAELMRQAGLRDIRIVDLNFGSVCIHIGTKA